MIKAKPMKPAHVHFLFLSILIGTGAIWQFVWLDSLPPWTDECATLVFSLGKNFHSVPLDEIINSEQLLTPLIYQPATSPHDVIQNLLADSTHPPAFFVLMYWWLRHFSTVGELVPIWSARALPALLGVSTIPAMFGLCWLASRSVRVAQVGALLVACSPLAIFLSRQARHYSLAILLAIASLSCFIIAVRAIHRLENFPSWLTFVWIGCNSLGVATHYFFTLIIGLEGGVLLFQAWLLQDKDFDFEDRRDVKRFSRFWKSWERSLWSQFLIVGTGSLVSCLVWLPFLQFSQGSRLTDWAFQGNFSLGNLGEIVARLFLWLSSIFMLLPSMPDLLPLGVLVINGVITLAVFAWLCSRLKLAVKIAPEDSVGVATQALMQFLFGAIGIIFICPLLMGLDLTLAARFQFFYLPVVIVIVAIALSRYLQLHAQGWQKSLMLVIGCSLLLINGLTSIWNLGYLQNYRPDLLAASIRRGSKVPVLITTAHKHHGQTGRMMGIAWELEGDRLQARIPPDQLPLQTSYFLVHKQPDTRGYQVGLDRLLTEIDHKVRPFDLWLIDFHAKMDLAARNCQADLDYRGFISGQKYKLYHCG